MAGDDAFDDAHVRHGVGNRRRDRAIVQDRRGEQIALDRVLIAQRQHDLLDASRALVTHRARSFAGRVEWDVDLDAAFGAENVHALIGDELRAARERGRAGGEIQDGRGDAIGAERRVVLDQAEHAARLGVEDEPRSEIV